MTRLSNRAIALLVGIHTSQTGRAYFSILPSEQKELEFEELIAKEGDPMAAPGSRSYWVLTPRGKSLGEALISEAQRNLDTWSNTND